MNLVKPKNTPHGFSFGSLLCEAVAEVNGHVVVRVLNVTTGQAIEVQATPKGRKTRYRETSIPKELAKTLTNPPG